MIRLAGEITYHDGRVETVEVLQGEFAAWELYALRMGIPPVDPSSPASAATPVLMLQYLGYAGAHRGKPRKDWPPFEDWTASVASVDLEGDADPSSAVTAVFPPARSAG